VASRKQERERRRAERLAAEREAAQAARKRLALGYGVAGALTAAVVAGIVVVILGSGGGESGDNSPANAHIASFAGASTNGIAPDGREGTPPPPVRQADLAKAAAHAGCDLRLNLPDEGNSHLPPNAPTPTYHTSPPTSGNHSPIPQSDGAYSEMPDPLHFVHALEHGRIEIQYSPDLSEQDQLALKGVFDQSPGAMLLFPNSKMHYQVAATAWTQLMGCKTYEGDKTLDAVRDFRDQFRGRGPEAVPFNPAG
jgi:hypothetical protein